ncbi:MAG: thioredoxin domain-containing protein [Chloroflexota bacterium]
MAQAEKSKSTKNVPSVSAKQSAKERRAAREQQQQRQQQIILGILAVALLIGVIVVVFVSTRPKEAFIPDDALSRYQVFADKKLQGTTAEGYPFLGDEKAPVVMEELASLSCIYCKQYHDQTIVNLLDEIEAGRLKLVFVPIITTGEFQPEGVTEGALCAAQQDKFWPMQDVAYDWQTRYGVGANDAGTLAAAADKLGMDTGKFKACLGTQAVKDIIAKGAAYADKVHLTGTPTVLLDGVKIVPADAGVQSPDLNQLRGLIETKAAAAKK